MKKGRISIGLGLLLIVAALFLAFYNKYEDYHARKASEKMLSDLERDLQENGENISENENLEVIPDYVLNPDMEMPTKVTNGIEYVGVLEIPSLELTLPIINEWSYPYLRISPCRYAGTAYQKNLVIAAHNYTAHFGNIKFLRQGDQAIFTDMDGNAFTYELLELETLVPTAVEYMQTGDWDMTLFTCTIGGASRVTARFQRVEDFNLRE